ATYIWSVNGVDVQTGSVAPYITLNNLNNNDTIRCKMISSENCVTQAEVVSALVVVTVNALPDVTVSVVNNTLTVPASATHQWYNCGNNNTITGATNATYTATANGDYKVAVTNVAGCTDTSVCINVNSIGIEEASINSVAVSPNPFSTDVTISVPEFSRGYTIEVYNCLGAIVKRTGSLSAIHNLQLADITSGIYFIKISDGTKSFVRRIEKQQ
ncbi:MAG TPA: T9SS type A sorting domain-containing protein, partial [Chitinophagales bacterium]|nr:T9SS type A sorting domain-containing protein [Chitinophagales bacterium]